MNKFVRSAKKPLFILYNEKKKIMRIEKINKY